MKVEEQRVCPACHDSKAKTLGEKNDFTMLSCQQCGSIFSSFLPADEQAEDYDEYYDESNLKVPEFVVKRLDEIISEFEPFRLNGRLLDVGFGAGTIMEVAKNRGWQVSGIEVSKPAVEFARKLGFEVFHGELGDAKFPDGHFDVVTASEIIEHCPQPEILLDEVRRILRPGGLFWATTPSAKGLSYHLTGLDWTTICPPEHLQLFSRKGIGVMLKKAGFSSYKTQTFGFNPLEIVNTYRKRLKKQTEADNFSRVETGYALNEGFTKSPVRKAVKSVLNNTLNLMSVGDSLKIKAVK